MGEAVDHSLELIKKKFSTIPILSLPDSVKTFEIERDANNMDIWAVPSQERKPIAFISEKLSEAR